MLADSTQSLHREFLASHRCTVRSKRPSVAVYKKNGNKTNNIIKRETTTKKKRAMLLYIYSITYKTQPLYASILSYINYSKMFIYITSRCISISFTLRALLLRIKKKRSAHLCSPPPSREDAYQKSACVCVYTKPIKSYHFRIPLYVYTHILYNFVIWVSTVVASRLTIRATQIAQEKEKKVLKRV